MLDEFVHYFHKAHAKQRQRYEGEDISDEEIGDDLINNVPIYDVVHRRYAAFSSFPEAIWYKEKDPKGNGKLFGPQTVPHDTDFAFMCYLFRLCGSGINYKPNNGIIPWHKSHGFGNFWIVDSILKGKYRLDAWIRDIPEKRFSDNKGYIIPQFSKTLRRFIQEDAYNMFLPIWREIHYNTCEIYQVADLVNGWLLEKGFRRQNFVATAWAMDLAEYFPHLVARNSRVMVGSNAKRCLKMIFPDVKGIGTNLTVTNDCLDKLIEVTGYVNNRMDMEDVACDFIRYIENYQSHHHILANDGKVYKNSLNV